MERAIDKLRAIFQRSPYNNKSRGQVGNGTKKSCKPVKETMNPPKRILITMPSLQDPGGVAGYYKSVLPHLRKERLLISTLEIGSSKGHHNRLHLISDQILFRQLITKSRPDLVHLNPSLVVKSFFRDGLFALQASRKKIPIIIFFRGWDKNFERFAQKILLPFFRFTYGKADRFIVLANEFKNVLHKWGITQPIHIGTTAVNDSLIANLPTFNNPTPINCTGEIKILFVSRLKKEKGALETIEAVSELIKKGIRITLSIAGDGPILEELKQLVKNKQLPENTIHFLGYIKNSEKIKALTEHHIFCFPTYFAEGLPNALLEAMAFGLPVVTRPVGGIADFFIEGKMGLLCRSKSADEVAACLEKLLSNKVWLTEISQFNFNYARKHFMGSLVAQKIANIYQLTVV